MISNIFFICIGFILLIKSADFLVDGCSGIAKKFHIPEIIIGLTVVSLGTSMPELMVSITSMSKGSSDMAIGNIVGSNMANLFLILGICSIIKPLKFQRETKIFENPITLFITLLLIFFCNNGIDTTKNLITRGEGGILLELLILFIMYTVVMAKKGEEFYSDTTKNKEIIENSIQEVKKEKKDIAISKLIIFIILGVIGLKYGGDFVVTHSIEIAQYIGISEGIISLTIVSISTSLPELITSITATIKGETDMAIGNVLGSQIFNILFIIGTTAFFIPISYDTYYNKYFFILFIGTLILSLLPFIGKKATITRKNGVLFFLVYVIYIVSLVY